MQHSSLHFGRPIGRALRAATIGREKLTNEPDLSIPVLRYEMLTRT
jgi:hypothetical protein